MEQEYLDLGLKLLNEGHYKEDRTGVGTYSIFGYQMRFNLQQGFPILTTKKIPFGLIKSELLWFLKGYTNIKYLLDHNNHIWDEWPFLNWINSDDFLNDASLNIVSKMSPLKFRELSDTFSLNYRLQDDAFSNAYTEFKNEFIHRIKTDEEFCEKFGDIGPGYGKQWRDFNGIDQITNVINQLKTNPSSRRMIVSAWNPSEIEEMALPPCHTMFQFYVIDNKLSCQLYQRSGDVFLGVPFNIASYALLTHLIAKETNLEVGEFIHTLGDAHLYSNHISQMKEQLSRTIKTPPSLKIKTKKSIFDYEPEDIILEDYAPDAPIKAEVAI